MGGERVEAVEGRKVSAGTTFLKLCMVKYSEYHLTC